ncbi:MAG: phosphoribosylglycinamide formyltransferase [Candidatus Kapaibacterium sp.]|jgi:phosphoribosylglycinamide formyltransferase-1
MLNLGFLSSHSGSNVQAIIDNVASGKLRANLCALVSNNSNAFVLERAKKANIPAFHISSHNYADPEKKIIEVFKEHNVNTVILAGYMKKVSADLIHNFSNRVLNIHPALLPKFGGEGMFGSNVHKAVIEAGEKISGATIHLVTPNYDDGKILNQMTVPVLDNDTPETLAKRVLEIEHILYTDTLIKIANGEILIP